jgi:phosphohistidine phosphatase
MDLYLVQHGEARPEAEDAARPLTESGRRDVEAVAAAAARIGIVPRRIAHSGKLRALQTAEILASALRPPDGVHEMPALGPKDDPATARSVVESAPGALMLVGHLPHLGRLTSSLLLDDTTREIVAFRMAAIVCLSRGPEGWRLRFILTPELVP